VQTCLFARATPCNASRAPLLGWRVEGFPSSQVFGVQGSSPSLRKSPPSLLRNTRCALRRCRSDTRGSSLQKRHAMRVRGPRGVALKVSWRWPILQKAPPDSQTSWPRLASRLVGAFFFAVGYDAICDSARNTARRAGWSKKPSGTCSSSVNAGRKCSATDTTCGEPWNCLLGVSRPSHLCASICYNGSGLTPALMARPAIDARDPACRAPWRGAVWSVFLEILEPIRGEFRVARRVLNVLCPR
jgi:hypothetical protein